MRLSPKQSLKLLRSQKAGAVIGSLLILMGIGAFLHVAKVVLDERRAKDWVAYSAQIDRADVKTHMKDDGAKTYIIDVAYSFDWKGTSYTGTQYRLHNKTNPIPDAIHKEVKSLLIAKQKGKPYPIFVNPKNPQQSAIVNKAHPKARSSSLFLGFLFSIMGYFTGFRPKLFGKRSE